MGFGHKLSGILEVGERKNQGRRKKKDGGKLTVTGELTAKEADDTG